LVKPVVQFFVCFICEQTMRIIRYTFRVSLRQAISGIALLGSSRPRRTLSVLAIGVAEIMAANAQTPSAPASTSPTVAGEPLRAPPVCSSIEVGSSEIQFPFCRVAPLPGGPGRHD
jgi:hypothetical protein